MYYLLFMGNKRKHSVEIENEVENLSKLGIPRAEIGLRLGMTPSKVGRVQRERGIKYTTEQHAKNRLLRADPSVVKFKESVLNLRRQGLKKADIAATLNVPVNKVHSVIMHSDVKLTQEQIGQNHRTYDVSDRDKVLDLRKKSMSFKEIAQILNLKESTVKYFCENSDVRLRKPYEKKKTKPVGQWVFYENGIIKIEGFLTQSKLETALKYIVGEENWLGEEVCLTSSKKYRWDMVFQYNGKKWVVEFDGPRHYRDAMVICRDREKDEIAKGLGYKTVRIPYWVQLTTETLMYYFGIEKCIEQSFSHGFITTKEYPASFCPDGIEIFGNQLRVLPRHARRMVFDSLVEKISKHGEKSVIPWNFSMYLDVECLVYFEWAFGHDCFGGEDIGHGFMEETLTSSWAWHCGKVKWRQKNKPLPRLFQYEWSN